MPKRIHVLTSDVYNRISAGEVVENPASVVKELVENSLDAGSKSINIEIAEGGVKLIKVSDDGSGIVFLDLEKVFLPHSTSKILFASDLENINTLGFRGEALASIASVAQVEIISKTEDIDIGGRVTIAGGKDQEISECSCKTGTTITVKNLFFNTPARLKFLKSTKQEENAVTNIVNRLMLANPNVSFKYIVDGKLVYNSVLNGLKEKIFTIYGKETAQNIIEIKNERNDLKLSGYISNPSFCKANRTYQTLIVNGRYISNNLVSVAVANAYENFLMKGKFPLFVLNLTLPSMDIDVNVHPSKMDVKFRESRKIYEFIYSSVLETLNESNSAKSLIDSGDLSLFEQSAPKFQDKQHLKEVTGGFSFGDMQNIKNELGNISVSLPNFKQEENGTLHSTFIPSTENEESNKEEKKYHEDSEKCLLDSLSQKERMEFNFFSKENLNVNPLKESFIYEERFLNEQQKMQEIFYNIVGTLFSTYLIIESGENCYLIDQHAGHERILYDKLLEDYDKKKVIRQDLLVPFVFDVNPVEKNLIEENIDIFNNLGFNIDAFGNYSYKINSIPHILSGIDLARFIRDCLKEPTKISKTNDEIKNRLARSACRSAIKSGDQLGAEEIKILLKQIMVENRILLCPHGRPICVKMTKYEIEKMFKRVV